jgi:hypothetical protein
MTQNETFNRLIALSEEVRPAAPAVHASLQAIAVALSVGLEQELLGIITTFTPLMERIKQAHASRQPIKTTCSNGPSNSLSAKIAWSVSASGFAKLRCDRWPNTQLSERGKFAHEGRVLAPDKMQDRALSVYDQCAPSLINGTELFRVLDALFEASKRLLLHGHLPQARHRDGSVGLARQFSLPLNVRVSRRFGSPDYNSNCD